MGIFLVIKKFLNKGKVTMKILTGIFILIFSFIFIYILNEKRHKALNEVLEVKELMINNNKIWISEEFMKKNINNYVIKEIFYSNGATFRKEIFNKETGEEITQYFSKTGEFIVEIKNSRLNNDEVVYDIYSQKFLVKKNGKFYDKEFIYTKKIKYYYDTGSIEEEFDDHGRIHGSRKVYDIDGDLYEDSFWEYGKPIGISKTYYKNGKLRSEGYRKYYNYEGIFKWYYESGELHIEENYKNGVLHGERIIYSKNGKVIEKSKSKNGELKKGILERIIKKPKIVEVVELRELLRRADVSMTDKEIDELEDFIIRQHEKNSQ